MTIMKKENHSAPVLTSSRPCCCFSSEAAEALKQFTSHNKPYVTAAAVVGIIGLKQIIYNAVLKFSGRNLVAFDSVDKAKDWLATQ